MAAGAEPTLPVAAGASSVLQEDYITSYRSISEIYQSAETRTRHASRDSLDG